MSNDVFLMRTGNLLPTLRAQNVEDDGETPIQITGMTFRLRIKKPTGILIKIGVIIDADNGIFEFPWVVGETDDPGTFPAEIEVTYLDGKPLSWPEFAINFRQF